MRLRMQLNKSDIQEFVNATAQYDGEIDLVNGRCEVDAKSILGIFSLDLSKPIELRVLSGNEGELLRLLIESGFQPEEIKNTRT